MCLTQAGIYPPGLGRMVGDSGARYYSSCDGPDHSLPNFLECPASDDFGGILRAPSRFIVDGDRFRRYGYWLWL